MAISRACSAMRVFIVAAIRNKAEPNARTVMMYSTAMRSLNPVCPGQ